MGGEFEDSSEEQASGRTGLVGNICGMISFEEPLEKINRVTEQPEIDEEMGFMFFPFSVNHMTRSGRHYQVPSSLLANEREGR